MPWENDPHAAPQPPAGAPQPALAAPPAAAQPQPAPSPLPGREGSAAAPRRPKPLGGKGWIVAIVGIVALCLVLITGIRSCAGVFSGDEGSAGLEALSGDAVGLIDMAGTIQYDGTSCSPEGLKAQLDAAAGNDHVKAVVLRVDSGGGVATAGEEMATYLREFCDQTGKPVVVSCASINASAAYEVSSQANCIFTARTSAVGAIGTAMQLTDYSGLMELLGISVEDITSAPSKDSSYGTRALTDEERAYYQHQVDQINDTFVQNVADGRHLSTDAVRALATGLTFTGADAVENGLADEIGTREDAIAYAADLAGCARYEVVDLAQDQTFDADVSALLDLLSESKDVTAADVAAALKELDDNDAIAR